MNGAFKVYWLNHNMTGVMTVDTWSLGGSGCPPPCEGTQVSVNSASSISDKSGDRMLDKALFKLGVQNERGGRGIHRIKGSVQDISH